MFLAIALFETSKSSTDKDQEIYLSKIGFKCGVLPDISTSTSRIINGRPSKQVYPWMAYIRNKVAVDPKYYAKANGQWQLFRSGGAIISDTTIITCGHCLCKWNKATGIGGNYAQKTCLKDDERSKDDQGPEANLNRQNINEIYIHLGQISLDKSKLSLVYDPQIEAYLYRYYPPGLLTHLPRMNIFSHNGDIGLIIKKNGLGLIPGKIAPICLPSPDVYYNKNGVDAVLVGWGFRYEEK